MIDVLERVKTDDAIEGRADELGRLESKDAGKPVGAAPST
jgi:hypothetical protein